MSEQKHYGWQEGLPTAPDVQAMIEAWPDLQVGDRVSYDDAQSVIKVEPGSSRWQSITNQWRKRLREKGLVIECEAGRAFYVATAGEISAATYGCLRSIGRKARGHRIKLALSRPANDRERETIEHQARIMNEVERDSKKARLNLLPPTAVPDAPRIQPPAKREGATK